MDTPEVKGGVVAYLNVDGATRAADFYQRALGAEIAASHPADDKGRTMHVHLYINNSSVMLCDFYPEHGHPPQKPQAFTMTLMVEDIDTWWRRVVDAGAEVVMPITDMFWGARYGQFRDPFGVTWALNEQKRA